MGKNVEGTVIEYFKSIHQNYISGSDEIQENLTVTLPCLLTRNRTHDLLNNKEYERQFQLYSTLHNYYLMRVTNVLFCTRISKSSTHTHILLFRGWSDTGYRFCSICSP